MALGDMIRQQSLARQAVRTGTFQLAPCAGAGFVSLETLGVEVYGTVGLGLPPITPVEVGGVHQTTVISGRSIVLRCVGADALGSAAALLALLVPDRAGAADMTTPAILRYVGAVRTLDIGVVLANEPAADPRGGLVLRLVATDPYWSATADVTVSLPLNEDTHAPYIIERATSGAWVGLGAEGVGPGGPVKCAVYGADGKLYVGLDAAPGVKVWDGLAWATVGPSTGSGEPTGLNGAVVSLGVGLDGRLWAAGAFTGQLAAWNGSTWTTYTPPGSGPIRRMRIIEGNPYICRSGDTNPLRYYNAQTASWWALPSPGTEVNDIAKGPDGWLYACGTFAGLVKKIDPNVPISWSAVGSGLLGDARSLWFAPDGLLYMGGPMEYAAYIWNGQTWRNLNLSPTDAGVEFVRLGEGVLIAGYFDGSTSGLLYWSGSDLYTLGILPGYPDAMAVASDGRIALGFGFADAIATAPLSTFTLQGTAAAAPVITVTGDSGLSTWLFLREITNHATSTSLYFSAPVIRANSTYVIDCDDRTVADALGADQTRVVVPGSRFLALAPGENRIGVLIEVAGGGGTVTLSYRPRFWSLESADRP